MRNVLKYTAICVLAALSALIISTGFSVAGDLMSQKSTLGLISGLVLATVTGAMTVGLLWIVGTVAWKRILLTRKPPTLVLAGLALLMLSGTACTRINAGHVGVVIKLAGGQRGAQDIPVTTGWVFYWPPSTSVYEYPTFVQTAVWTANAGEGHPANEEIQFASSEGMAFTADISLSYQLDPEKVPHFYVQFRSDDLNAFTHGFLRNVARDAFQELASRYTTEQLYGSKKEEFVRAVRARIDSIMAPFGVELQQFGYIGNPRPPEAVLTALNNKVKAIQDAQAAQNRVAQISAEAEQTVARARGEAEANRVLASSISPQLLDWRRLAITEQAIARWNGQRPQVEGVGSGGLLLNVTPPTAH